MNYFSVIRTLAGQTTQPQSCAFLHGVDWMPSTLNGRALSATRGWSLKRYRTPWTPLGLRKAGSFITHFVPLALLRGLRCVVVSVVGKRPEEEKNNLKKYREDSSTFEIPYSVAKVTKFVAKVGEPDVATASRPILIPVKLSPTIRLTLLGSDFPCL
ncbi:hypothetical protein AVEN_221767-1 [Araneus ventricosus]|uniref:Uncharacterized protein n=1 Tax=Araneus ventricosus TaxID=182803 RepID=A0A4Y2FQ15_ARAVE|nr:hypothetical protein AVEN_221767-1 [Araneus ventricosus]